MKSGFALRRFTDPRAQLRVHACSGEVVNQAIRFTGRQGLEQHGRRVQLAAGPRWPAVQQLRPCRAEEQHRGVTAQNGNVLDEVEQRRLGPMDVVDRDHQRLILGHGLEQLAHAPGNLVRRADGVRFAEYAEDRFGRELV
jgi:hypothetical protein